MLERAEYDCDNAEGYRDQFHQADKRAAVLEEKLKPQTALEIRGAAIGVAPSIWKIGFQGPIALALGLVLV
jgi:hypothetical protein